jgi:phosphoribosylformylglycinamidine synthase
VPIGATNCLNFGNPERPEIMWQFSQAVDGIAEACRALDVPITGGNVSLYNETDGQAIYPTPVLGVVGVLDDVTHVLTRVFPESDLEIVLLGDPAGGLGGSEYLKQAHGLVRGTPAPVDLERERALQALLVDAARGRWIRSAHDGSDGGLAVTLAECCVESGGVGAQVDLPGSVETDERFGVVQALFGEAPSRVVVSVATGERERLLSGARERSVPAVVIGRTGGDRIRLAVAGVQVADIGLDEAEQAWGEGLTRHFETVASKEA